MIPLSLAAVAEVVGGDLRSDADAARRVAAVAIDSREVQDGTLFVPLPGEHTDGHAFLDDAARRGAAGYLVAAGRPEVHDGPAGGITVDDPADALLGLGTWVRDEVDPVVVAITGSNGKTTTKDLLAAALEDSRATVANAGSYNNELGVPLTCCRLEPDSQVLVAEVGARGLGHVASLASVLRPDVGVVTGVGASHLERLGDIETVALAKRELVEAVDHDGVAVLNADDHRVAAMASHVRGHVVTYGVTADAHWRAENVRTDGRAQARFTARHPGGNVEVALPAPGLHNVSNALAALAAASAVGVDPQAAAAGLAEVQLSRWRMELTGGEGQLLILNDAYNANPQSMRAALDTLAALPARRRWAVLGLMAELGSSEREAHEQVGERCAALGLDGLVVVGTDAAAIAAGAERSGFAGEQGIVLVSDTDAARAHLVRTLRDDDAVLIKASRAVGLERLAAALTSGVVS